MTEKGYNPGNERDVGHDRVQPDRVADEGEFAIGDAVVEGV